MQSTGSTRSVGVTVPQSQLSSGTGKPNSLLHCVPAQFAAIQYADDAGRIHDEVVMVVGGQPYLFPNGEAWAKSLRPVSTWLADKIMAQIAPAPPPSSDAVEIIDPLVDASL